MMNSIWLDADQELKDEDADYSVEVTGRPEITGEEGGWSVLLRAHGWTGPCFGNDCDEPPEAYACTVNTAEFDCSLTLSGGLTSGEDRFILASTEMTDCESEAASPELWVLYGFAVGEELGCEVKIPSGARFSIDDKDDAYETGAAGIAGAGVGHTFRNVSIVERDTPSWPPSSMPNPASTPRPSTIYGYAMTDSNIRTAVAA